MPPRSSSPGPPYEVQRGVGPQPDRQAGGILPPLHNQSSTQEFELAKLTPPSNISPTMDAHLTARAPKTDHMLQYEYARSAFRLGLGLGVAL